jgi:hypothetical protein
MRQSVASERSFQVEPPDVIKIAPAFSLDNRLLLAYSSSWITLRLGSRPPASPLAFFAFGSPPGGLSPSFANFCETHRIIILVKYKVFRINTCKSV